MYLKTALVCPFSQIKQGCKLPNVSFAQGKLKTWLEVIVNCYTKVVMENVSIKLQQTWFLIINLKIESLIA